MRNWLIGYYIVEFQQNGKDRSKYGENLLMKLAQKSKEIKGIDERSLRNFRTFYFLYPQMEKMIPKSTLLIPIRGSVMADFQIARLQLNGKRLVDMMSYTQLEQLLNCLVYFHFDFFILSMRTSEKCEDCNQEQKDYFHKSYFTHLLKLTS